jgi:hypothetical protein
MKNTFKTKRTLEASAPKVSAGPKGMSITPPPYGIESLDRAFPKGRQDDAAWGVSEPNSAQMIGTPVHQTIQLAKKKNLNTGNKIKRTKFNSKIKKPKHVRRNPRPQRIIRAGLASVQNVKFYDQYGLLNDTNVAGEESGSDAELVIGPRTGQYLGNGPDQNIMPNTINWLNINLPTANNWVRGHLLNDWLGGRGDRNDNLAPMSHTTNQQWNRNFEEPMKKITERFDSFYANSSGHKYFILTGYIATASGSYAPASQNGVNIPNQFDGALYYAAYDRDTRVVKYGDNEVTAAFNELDPYTRNAIQIYEQRIATPIMQVH